MAVLPVANTVLCMPGTGKSPGGLVCYTIDPRTAELPGQKPRAFSGSATYFWLRECLADSPIIPTIAFDLVLLE